MAGTAATRSARVGRVGTVLGVFVAVVALTVAVAPGDGAASAPGPVPAAAPGPPAVTSPPIDLLAAPASTGPGGPAPTSGGAVPPSGEVRTEVPPPGPAPAPGGGPPVLVPGGTPPVLLAGETPAPTAAPPAAPPPPPVVDEFREAGIRAARVTDRAGTWASFTLLDRRTGRRVGDARSQEVTNTESTVKAWLAADLLATRAAQGRTPTAYEQTRMAAMIRASDDNAAQVIWRSLGADASIRKMIRTCRLTDTTVYPDWWSLTQISSRDLAALGACIIPGPGRFLSPTVGAPLVTLMRTVEPSNAFGIPQARPAGPTGPVAVKNGWTEHGGTGLWNVNCLGIWGPAHRWVLAVTTRYPITRGLDHGATTCRRVTTALLPLVRS